ncbi:hypothetical protein SMICM304S_11126 [Streptomyces microflavus]
MGVAPCPPASSGQCRPAYPASYSIRCQVVSYARRAGQSSGEGFGGRPGSTAASHSPSRRRNSSSASVSPIHCSAAYLSRSRPSIRIAFPRISL